MDYMRLTPHFRLSEFTRSETASRLGIDNNVKDPKVVDNLRRLCEKVLEPLRNHTKTPIVINSGYRCPRLNAAVGGSPSSNHLKGCAADLRLSSESQAKEWFDWLKANTDFDELILERASPASLPWIHVALRAKGNRRKTLYVSLAGR